MKVTYEKLTEYQITRELFSSFNRHQEVTKCWRREEGRWRLKDIVFVEDWNEQEYAFLVKCLKNTVRTGGYVFGAFLEDKLVGFSSVESRHFGSGQQYVQLSCIHVSCESRGQHIGEHLFMLSCAAGRRLGAQKLYISAHSSMESQAFYHAMGCVEAREYDMELAKAEPCDCQLEKVL